MDSSLSDPQFVIASRPRIRQPGRARSSRIRAALANPALVYTRVKWDRRILDILVASVGIVLTLPIMLIVAAFVKSTSRGPILFSQVRVGLDRRSEGMAGPGGRRTDDIGGRPFRIFKFRTMSHARERATEQVWATKNDPRITPLGKVLRKFRLDELPQLFNVLRGDMSIVGPRPEQPALFQTLRHQVPRYTERQRAQPGITGLAQINHAYDESIDDVRRKVEYDLAYLEKVSVWQDIQIMVKTIPVMIFRRGAH